MPAVSSARQISYIFFKRILVLSLTRNTCYTRQQKAKAKSRWTTVRATDTSEPRRNSTYLKSHEFVIRFWSPSVNLHWVFQGNYKEFDSFIFYCNTRRTIPQVPQRHLETISSRVVISVTTCRARRYPIRETNGFWTSGLNITRDNSWTENL